jgi:hypothetical protein
VNVGDVAALIAGGLAAAGIDGVPVVDPGTPIATLPAVVLAPGVDELEAGNRSLRHGLEVTVVVSRSGQPEQYTRLQQITGAVLRGLLPSSVQIVDPFPFDSFDEPPTMTRTIPCSFVGDLDLC